jgi:uncharacterized protein (TIGR02246 family)
MFTKREMKVSQTYRADSAPLERKPLLRGRIHRLGLTLLASALVITAIGTATAQARDEAAVRALGDGFAKNFLQKNAEARASLFAQDGTFVTPQGHFLNGHVAMVNEFGPEAQHAVNGTTQAAFSDYRIRFIKPDVAVADAILTVRNVNGPDGSTIPTIPISFFYVAVRHGDHWLIQDGRAHFSPAPPNAMTSQK